MTRVLIVDDDAIVRELLTTALGAQGFTVSAEARGAAMVARVQAERPDVVIMDMLMADCPGILIMQELVHQPYRPPVVVFTGYLPIEENAPIPPATQDLLGDLYANGVVAAYPKGIDLDVLAGRLRAIAARGPVDGPAPP